MNKDDFATLSSKQRVKIVNDLLKKGGNDLQKVAKTLGINYSTFTKLMQEDDYVYIKRIAMYCKFVQDESLLRESPSTEGAELDYIKENFQTLKELIEQRKDNNDFKLDKRIFHSNSKSPSRNFRIPDNLYEQFTQTCEQRFPHLQIQHIVAQCLLNFVDQYSDTDE